MFAKSLHWVTILYVVLAKTFIKFDETVLLYHMSSSHIDHSVQVPFSSFSYLTSWPFPCSTIPSQIYKLQD